MQQLCSNKFVSPTTGATISSAQFGILLALLFMPASTLWSRAIFAFATAILGTWIFVWFIQRIQFKDVVMVSKTPSRCQYYQPTDSQKHFLVACFFLDQERT